MAEIPINYLKYIDQDGTEKKVYPITVTDAVYDSDGNKLSNVLLGVLKDTDISNVQSDSTTTVPSSALLKATDDKIGDTSSLPGESSNVVSAITQLNSDLISYKNGVDIGTLSSPSQLTSEGYYRFLLMSNSVNENAGSETMTDYNIGDFVALLVSGPDKISDQGCKYGTLLVTSPRIPRAIWIGTIWQYQFTSWAKTITNADLDGHIVLLSGGSTALEASSGNTRFRLQLNTNGNVTLYRSTDGGSTWPESKNVATWS